MKQIIIILNIENINYPMDMLMILHKAVNLLKINLEDWFEGNIHAYYPTKPINFTVDNHNELRITTNSSE